MPETEEQKRRRQAELEELMQRALGDNLGRVPGKVAPVPFERDTYTPGGAYHFTRNPREYDASAVAPMGEVPRPADPELADEQQDELDQNALYDLHERERAEEAATEAKLRRELELDSPPAANAPPAAPPPAAPVPDQELGDTLPTPERDPFNPKTSGPPPAAPPPPAPPVPVIDQFVDAFTKLRAMRAETAPVDTGAKVEPDKSFSPERQMAAAGQAYDAETARRDPVRQFDEAGMERELLRDDSKGPRNELRMLEGLAQTRTGPNARTPEELRKLEQKGLVLEPSDTSYVRSSVTPDQMPNPYGESDTKWEDEFLRTHDRLTNQQIRRRAAVIGMFGSDQEQKAFTDREVGFAEDYDKGLAEARERDRLERRVTREDATAIAGTGAVDPESAATLTNRSLPSQAYPNGMYAMGRNAERSDKLYQQFNLGQLGENARQNQRVEAEAERTDKTVAAGLMNAQTYAQMRQRTEKAQLSHQEHAGLFAATAQDSFGLPREVGLEAFDGDFSRVPPELMDKVENALARIKPFTAEADLKGLGPGMAQVAAKIPYSAAKVEADTIARGKADPQFAYKTQNDMLKTGMHLNHGIQAWNSLSEQGKRDFARFGGKGIGAILANGLKNEKDRALAGPVWTVLNNLIQERSGVAVTESEWGRTANEIGLAQGIWDPFNTYEGIEIYLNNAADVMGARFGLYQRNFGWK